MLACALLCVVAGDRAYANGCLKKGIGVGPAFAFMNGADLLKRLGAHWYYDWNPESRIPPEGAGGAQFVPMVSGKSFRLGDDLQLLAQHATAQLPVVFAFNEPDLANGRAMSVDEAVALWPRLERGARRLGSPAPSTRGIPWLRAFMARARDKHLRVDFLAIHDYGPPRPQRLLATVDALHREFGLPIWITEFGVRSPRAEPNLYTPAQVVDYLRTVLPALEQRPYVERFAWFGEAHKPNSKVSAFFNPDGTLTDVGRYYASFEANVHAHLCGAS